MKNWEDRQHACWSCFKGEKPENIAVELPEKLELHTNKEMADALGIDISKLESKE